MKKLLTLTSDVKKIKLQAINLSINNFWSFFQNWKKLLAKNSNLIKTFLLGTFGTITLGVYNLSKNDLIHKAMKFKG